MTTITHVDKSIVALTSFEAPQRGEVYLWRMDQELYLITDDSSAICLTGEDQGVSYKSLTDLCVACCESPDPSEFFIASEIELHVKY